MENTQTESGTNQEPEAFEASEPTQKPSYAEKKEERDRSKDIERRAQARKDFTRKIRNSVIGLVVVALTVYGFILLGKSQAPQDEDLSHAVPLLGRDHIEVGSAHEAYNSNPPTSGSHYADPAPIGFYTANETLPDEQLVHNLEHGEIWIAYHPRLAENDTVMDVLRSFDTNSSRTIITARAANETDIALVAWGRVDTFDLIDNTVPEHRIKDFVKRYRNKGPERVMQSVHR